jgi:SAM-dependent methyltransferase
VSSIRFAAAAAGDRGDVRVTTGTKDLVLSADEACLVVLTISAAGAGRRFDEVCRRVAASVTGGTAARFSKWPLMADLLVEDAPAGKAIAQKRSRWASAEDKQRLWDGMYRRRHHEGSWDLPYASPELIVALTALDLDPNASCLDLGCGAGSDVVYLAEQGYRVTGVDVSAEALAIAAQRLKTARCEANLVRADVADLPFDDESFDFVTDRGCYHHVEHSRRRKYAREVGRILKPGGRLLLRGCRVPGAFWVPLEEAELRRVFSRTAFVVSRLHPFRYEAAAPIAGAITMIRKLEPPGSGGEQVIGRHAARRAYR